MKNTLYKSLLLFSVFFFFPAVAALAQKNSQKGDKLFDKNLFKEAIPYYIMEVKARNNKTTDYALLRLADCYRIVGDFEKAEATYKILLKKKKKDPKAVLNYAISLKSSAKYAEAAVQFKEYIKLNPSDPMGEMYLKSCSLAQVWLDETIGKEVRNVDKINSELADFAPVFVSPDELVYTSSKPGGTVALVSFDGGNEIHRLDLYSVEVNSINEKPEAEIQNMKAVNSPLHEGPATFSKDGSELYFTRTINGKREKKTNEVLNTLQVFYCKRDSSGKWSRPESAFSFNSTEYSVGQPSLSGDGKTIYYMSDMPGGKGGTDIYYSTRQNDGKWSPPKNIEGEINTFGHELFPYISDNGILYFSSDTHPGMGQLDIFYAEWNNGKWTNITNMKPPINSIANDFGIALDEKYMRGFFSSDRFNGKGAEDIYSFSDPTPLKLTVNADTIQFPDKSIYDGIKYKLVNEKDKTEMALEPVNGNYFVRLDQFQNYTLVARKNGFPYNKVKMNLTRDTLGNYLEVKLKPSLRSVMVDGYLKTHLIPDSSKSRLKGLPLENSTVMLIDSSTTVEKTITIKSGFFEFGQKLNPNEEYTIISKINVPKDPPDPIVHVNGVIMCSGNPLNDASVQLLEDGKLVENFKANGKGSFHFDLNVNKKYSIVGSKMGFDTNAVAFSTNLNDAKNGLFKTINLDSLGSIGLRGNVRDMSGALDNVQIVIRDGNEIVGELKSSSGGMFNYSLFPGRDYTITATANGYMQQEAFVSTKKGSGNSSFIPVSIRLDSIKVNSIIELKNLYYDYNKPDVQFASLPALDKLVEFMRVNPTVRIELAANTDSRGNSDYNLELSKARAQYAKDYLTLEDISPERVVSMGYGKEKPIIVNAKNEQEHQINRRTEIKILGK